MHVVVSIVVICLSMFFALALIAFMFMEAHDKLEYLRDHAPKLVQFLERPESKNLLLGVFCFLLLADGVELAMHEIPEVPEPPKVVWKAPPPPTFDPPPPQLIPKPPSPVKSPEVKPVETITSYVVETRISCLLRNPETLPEDVIMYGDPSPSYIEGTLGKTYLRPLDGIQHHRTDEEGMAYTIQRYELPNDSSLIGRSVNEIENYSVLHFVLSGISGKTMKECRAMEVIQRLNGREIQKDAQAINLKLDEGMPGIHFDMKMTPKLQ
jgi:hypothetical protein